MLRFLVDAFMSPQETTLPLIKRDEYLKDASCIATEIPFIASEDLEDILSAFGLEDLADRLDYNANLTYVGPETVQNLNGTPSLVLNVRMHGGDKTAVFSLIGKNTELHAAIKQAPDGETYQLDHIHIRDYKATHDVACGDMTGNRDCVERLVGAFKESAEYLRLDLAQAIEEPELKLAKRIKPILQDMSAMAHRAEPIEIPSDIVAFRP